MQRSKRNPVGLDDIVKIVNPNGVEGKSYAVLRDGRHVPIHNEHVNIRMAKAAKRRART